jgi:large subunit ribosomal protein L19
MAMLIKTNIKVSPVEMEKRAKLDLRVGNTVRVYQKIQEKGKVRLQAYEGLIIAHKHGTEAGATITVRRTASGVGMEKIFQVYSPNIEKFEVTKRAKVRRAKLYFIRDKDAREVRRRLKRVHGFLVEAEDADKIVAEAAVVAPAETSAKD